MLDNNIFSIRVLKWVPYLIYTGALVWFLFALHGLFLPSEKDWSYYGELTFDFLFYLVVVFSLIVLKKGQKHIDYSLQLAKHIPAVIFAYDLTNKKILFLTGQVKEILGYSENEFQNFSPNVLRQIIHLPDLEIFLKYLDSFNNIKLYPHSGSHQVEEAINIEMEGGEGEQKSSTTSPSDENKKEILERVLNQVKKLNPKFDYSPYSYIRIRLRSRSGMLLHTKVAADFFLPLSTKKRKVIIGYMQDITHEVELEEKNTMEKANSAHLERLVSLGDMAGGIAHEINNPLAVILGRSEVLRLKATQNKLTQEFLIQSLEKIETATKRANKVINNLKMLTQDSSYETEVLTNLDTLFDELLSFWSERLKTYNVDFKMTPEHPDILILCKPLQMVLVFLNLFSNSFQAIKDKEGEKWIHVNFETTQEKVKIIITDSGKGIPYEIRTKIFNPFFTTKPAGVGVGLGLTIIVSILKAHHGNIYLDDTHPNTCFVIEIPAAYENKRVA